MLLMKRGKYVGSEGIKLPNEEEINNVDLDMGYKYQGVLEADGMKGIKMKMRTDCVCKKKSWRERFDKRGRLCGY